MVVIEGVKDRVQDVDRYKKDQRALFSPAQSYSSDYITHTKNKKITNSI